MSAGESFYGDLVCSTGASSSGSSGHMMTPGQYSRYNAAVASMRTAYGSGGSTSGSTAPVSGHSHMGSASGGTMSGGVVSSSGQCGIAAAAAAAVRDPHRAAAAASMFASSMNLNCKYQIICSFGVMIYD